VRDNSLQELSFLEFAAPPAEMRCLAHALECHILGKVLRRHAAFYSKIVPGYARGMQQSSTNENAPGVIRVLVVDDEDDFATALVERLRRRGFAAEAVFSGQAALERLGAGRHDVAVLDLKMPGIDGLAALREIKRAGLAVAVIVLTGHGTVASGIDGMQIGAADFLQKPVDVDALCTAIRAAAERAGTEDQGESP
jgi:CheY-like chemotaxis protein